MVDQQSVQNLQIVLIAPNNAGQITLVSNQIDAANKTNNGVGLPGGNAIGVFGFSSGAAGTFGTTVGTVFDDNATRNIFDPTNTGTNGNSATNYIGTFRAEGGSLKSFLASIGSANINGTWKLQITNFSASTTAPVGGSLRNLSLQFSTGMSASSPSTIDDTPVNGAIGDTYPLKTPSSPNTGVGPGLVLTADNTVGPGDPFSGRIYAAYVDYFNEQDPNTHANPTTNTDIVLAYFDPRQGWVPESVVNDDNAITDGFSGSGGVGPNFAYTSGRTQFQPEIAVDEATGTLVLSWRDARDDAANARVATYITTSLDGGQTFSPQTYANPQNTATDAITGLTDVLGPVADNESAGNPQVDAGFGYGDQMGLAVFDGQVFPVWAGNFNQSFVSNNVITADPLNVWVQPMAIAAGPRIINSSMGPIPLAEAASGVVSISVTFDRAINPNTFGAGNVQVFYHDTNKADGYVSLHVFNVVAVPGSGDTQFTITFNPTPNGSNPATFNHTGTYSYLIAPDAGPGTIPISSEVWSLIGTTPSLRQFDPMDENADGTSDENALTTSFTGQTPGDVYAVPTPLIPADGAETTFLGMTSILQPTFGLNPNTLPLIVPGPQVVSTSVPGGNSASGNLITDGTTNTFNVTFDRPMVVNTAAAGQPPTAGSFTAADVLSIMGPAGEITGPQFFPSDVQTGQPIDANSTTDYTVTVPSFGGTFSIADITVSLSAAFSPDSDLEAVLIAPNGTQVPLFSGVGGNGLNFVNTVLDDSAENSINSGTAPFTGSFKPSGTLSSLDGLPVDFKNSFGLWVPGVWTLQLTSSSALKGTLDNWSLSITPQISVAPVVSSESQNGTAATQFQIGFPVQQLSGTYTLQISPTIKDTFGDALDTNQNAGLAVVRDTGQNSPTSTVNYKAGDLPKVIPAPTQTAPSTVSSTITVPDNFLIQGDTTSAKVSGMQVQVALTYPHDPDLTATLSHFDLGGNLLGSVTLFSDVGNGNSTANFNNTIFDDNGATPIQNGAAPFSATFSPQQSLATAFAGQSAQGTWTLVIQNATIASMGTGASGSFTGWSLSFQKPLPTTGLGEPGSDIFTGSFRIFTLSQVDALSSQQWTAVGPASIGSGSTGNADPSGRVTGLAIDPSDPSGNTVYAGGASGGIWKTTDFLTPDPNGPTWIPLTDFGPTSGVNTGGIAIFPRNNDPNQSIVVVATGEGDTGTPGVGFLISQNGGATWVLDDSTNNVDASGNELPIESSSRNREFVGDAAFQVVIDPTPSVLGGVIIYAALSGPTGGVWRSQDTGKTWQLMLSGQATSVVLAPGTGATSSPGTGVNVQGNLQVVYAALRGTGVFMSPNQGQVWAQMLGGIGNPLIFDTITAPFKNVNPTNGPTPNGAQGRIQLAVPTATGNIAQDAVYAGWLYAIVATPAGALDGIFVTKDFGQNWTEVRIPTEPNQGYQSNPAIPANDVTLADYPIIGSAMFPQGNYNIAIAVDPTDPSVIYVGGTEDGNQSGLIRINLTAIWDAHALVATSFDANDGGRVSLASTGPATISNIKDPVDPGSFLNFIRNPEDPFVGDATLDVFNYASFTNNGAGVEWIPFDVGGTDYHKIATTIDPLTGLPRLIFGNDQGIWSVLDNNGTFETQIGTSDALAGISRNGNLQITQFYYGAAQPSNAAALMAQALFYGSAQDNGGPMSDPGIINNGDIVWNGPGGDATGVATDQQGNGTLYQYWWPCCGGNDTDFFQVDGTGRTNGLLQASNGNPTPDPQWPFTGGANFAVNPINGQDIVISSQVGRIFSTTNEGVTWFDIGDPAIFNTPGSFSVALAYGAPDPSAPSGIGDLANFIYVGTAKGQVYVTQDGGGSGSGNNWFNISLGLDGSTVRSIITDPTRGSHDAYAVTNTGVFYLQDSILLANNPTNAAFEWVNITGNLKSLAYSIFGQAYNPATDPASPTYFQGVSLSSIVADWRYTIPNTQGYANGPAVHPALYVGAGNSGGTGSGVFQSLDGGKTWTYFPDTTYGAVVEGGYLPHVAVTSLSLSLGNIDPNTGMPDLAGPDNASTAKRTAADPDVLMAATYGQGEFAINLAPLILGNAVTATPTGAPTGTINEPVVGGPFTVKGSSEITGFGNTTWITIEDVTNPAAPTIIAGFNPANGIPVPSSSNSTDALGNFSFKLDPSTIYSTLGVKSIEVFATDDAGSVGNKVIYTFNYDPATQLQFASTGEPPATGLPGVNFAAPLPVVVDAEDAAGNIATTYSGPVTISLVSGSGLTGTLTVNAVGGVATFSNLAIANDGTYHLLAMSPTLATTNPPSTSILIVGPASQLAFVQEPPGSVVAGSLFGFEVEAEDSFGTPTPLFTGNVTVAMGVNAGGSNPSGVAQTVAAVAGVADFTGLTLNKVGQGYTLKVSSTGLTGLVTTTIDVTNAPADHLVITTEPPGAVTAGQTFTMNVTAFDPFGNIDIGFAGQVAISLAGGTLTGGAAVNVANGVASFTNLAIDTIGTYQLLASSNPALTTAMSTSIVVSPAAPFQLVWASGGEPPAQVVHNFPFGAALDLEDKFGNLETGVIGTVSIALDANPGGANLGGDTSADLVGGVASFTSLSISELGSGYTLQATSGSLTSPASTPIMVTPTPAVSLSVTAQPPSNVTVAQGFGFQVTALDQFGNPDPDFNGSVSVALASGPTLTLHGTPTVTAVAGVATFTGLTVDVVGSGYTLAVSSTGLPGVTTNSFAALPGNATQLVITTEPKSTVAAGSQFGFVVAAEDQFNNLATGFNGNETITVESGPSGGALSGTVGANATNGIANVTGLILTKAGTYTLQVSSPNLTSVITTSVTVTPLAASQFIVSSEPPSSVVAGVPFGLTVTALDTFNNVATGFNNSVTIALAQNPGTGTLGTTPGNFLVEPASGGVAQFAGLLLDIVGSPYTISASSTGVASAALSTPISVTPAAATKLMIYIPPPTTMTSGSQFGLATEALDAFGNLATGYTGLVTIALASNPGNATLSVGPQGSLTVASVGGVANFHAYITTETAGAYTLKATSGSLTPVTTNSINVIPAPATHLVLIKKPPTLVTPGSAFEFTVAAEDDFGNITLGYNSPMTVTVPAGSGASLAGTTTVTPMSGQAAFSGLTLTESNGSVVLTVTSGGFSVSTAPVSVTTPAQVAFAASTVTVNQSAGQAAIEVVRTGGYTGPITVNIGTSNGTAVAGVNYTPISQTLSFADGQNSQMVMVPINSSSSISTPVTVNISLSSPGTYATLGSLSTATLVIQSASTPPPLALVTMQSVGLVTNKKHMVTQIVLGFSGALNAAEARALGTYELIAASKSGTFTPTKKNLIKIKSATYSGGAVTLKLKAPLRLKKGVELVVNGTAPSGLQDSSGHLIDGNHDGTAGGNAVAIIKKPASVTIQAVPAGPMSIKLPSSRRK